MLILRNINVLPDLNYDSLSIVSLELKQLKLSQLSNYNRG